jgi:SAM-dependent methyltransferase
MYKTIEYARIADLYDTYVRTTFDIPFFLEQARGVSGEVLELMSGTGRVSLPLAEAGVRLTCVDRSPEMLAILRVKLDESGLLADTHQMDARELLLPKKFGLIFIAFHSFPEILTRQDQRQALERIWEHLEPGGRFICTLHSPAVRLKPVDGELHLWGRYQLENVQGKLLLWGLQQYDRQTRIVNGLQMYEEYDARGFLLSKRLVEFSFYLFQKGEFEELICSVGFRVEALYGDYTQAPYDEETSPFMIFVLAKETPPAGSWQQQGQG